MQNKKTSRLIIVGIFITISGILIFLFKKYIFFKYDILITNVIVHDGTNKSIPYLGAIAIKDNYIKKIWKSGTGVIRPRAARVINAYGLDLSPGFIDSHSHADESILTTNGPIRADNFVMQGITTVVTGNCGSSTIDINALERKVNNRGININIASYIGFNSIRNKVMCEDNKPANRIQIDEMREIAIKGMEDGAIGISTGMAYPPGNYASKDEIISIIGIVGKYNGIHATHMRSEGKDIVEAINEEIENSRMSKTRLLISHFKIVGYNNCYKYNEIREKIKNAINEGMQIYIDQYPYDASSTNLNVLLPEWYLKMNSKDKLKALRSSKQRNALKKDIKDIILHEGFKNLEFAIISFYPSHPDWQGENIDQLTENNKSLSKISVDKCIDIILEIESHGGAEIIYHNTCEDVLNQIPFDFQNMVCTDSAIRYSSGEKLPLPHPRGWGAFPKFIKYFVTDKNILSLDDAIFRMTSLPAEVLGLGKRGAIKKNYYADIVLFDSKIISDRATYKDPLLSPIGIEYVIVNGKIVVDNKENIDMIEPITPGVLNVFPGKFIRRQSDSKMLLR
jgi:N-acyl-D-amino-acid deacylase